MSCRFSNAPLPGDAFRLLAVETYGCLDGPFDSGSVPAASSSTLACFFRQRVFVALQRTQAVVVCRRTMALSIAYADLPSLSPSDPLHDLEIAHIVGFPRARCA